MMGDIIVPGIDELNTDATESLATQLNDQARISYYHNYLQQLLIAIRYLRSHDL